MNMAKLQSKAKHQVNNPPCRILETVSRANVAARDAKHTRCGFNERRQHRCIQYKIRNYLIKQSVELMFPDQNFVHKIKLIRGTQKFTENINLKGYIMKSMTAQRFSVQSSSEKPRLTQLINLSTMERTEGRLVARASRFNGSRCNKFQSMLSIGRSTYQHEL